MRGVALVHPEPDLHRELDRAVPVGELQSSCCLVLCCRSCCCCCSAGAAAVTAAAAAAVAAAVVVNAVSSAAGTGASVWPLPHGLSSVVAVISVGVAFDAVLVLILSPLLT